MINIINDDNLIAGVNSLGRQEAIGATNGALHIISKNGNGLIDTFNTTEFTYVVGGDIDEVNYISGSEGKVKTIKQYNNDAVGGDYAVLITYYYGNATYPTKESKIVVSESTV